MIKKKRYILVGTWGCNHNVYHKTLIKNPELYKNLRSITFDDGTSLKLYIEEVKPYERVIQIHGYDKLIEKCLRKGVNSVVQLKKLEFENDYEKNNS